MHRGLVSDKVPALGEGAVRYEAVKRLAGFLAMEEDDDDRVKRWKVVRRKKKNKTRKESAKIKRMRKKGKQDGSRAGISVCVKCERCGRR